MAEGKKRIVKNPESFRERALKTREPKENKVKSASKLSAPFRAIGTSVSSLTKIKALKPLFKVLSLIGKIIWPAYFRNSFKELQGVTWPGRKQGFRLTYAVLIFAIVFGVAVALVDYGLGKVFKSLLLK
jgi:preprotein translocase SecE subunit